MEKTNENSAPSPQQRWDPFLKEWVIYAPARSKRPFQGKEFAKNEPKKTWTCPFCPDAPEGAGIWTVKQLPNRFASLNEIAPEFVQKSVGNLYNYQTASNYGKCEVILYSQDHDTSFGTLAMANIVALIDLWAERYIALQNMPEMRYPFIMENRGKEIGNSMTHPHGQIYSFPYLPPKMERKFIAFKDYYSTNQSCLMCDILQEELQDSSRIIEQNEDFIAEIPFYAHWAFEVQITAKRHVTSIADLSPSERSNLAVIMQNVVRRYDTLFGDGGIMPYVMAMYNAPVNVDDRDRWHFHIEFYTPFRGKDKWKFLAGVELGANTFISDALPEQNAKILRDLQI
ncbi:hypothetical protein NEF87_002397 [Candidatus Lokiarchaeum ossiferum]|uniref:UDP-glucose--hexose-1-phosphate uridylyltransferase n=1 Tax=Candidatus Lokiarchaeum ossiferum TaxID=2951803 RepID=A0ABY6HRH0_9ARCH|nr:hypothetical protein NEF87_002397 [Candidatus Lokiarchaeum sp. B-35]